MFFEKYMNWMQNATDEDILRELEQIQSDPVEIENRFFKDLEFGTGGLRGILGAGSNYMNIYTVGRATQGVAAYMQRHAMTSCAISYDSRNMSLEFARLAAAILASNGITVYLSPELAPTPFLSFCVRHLKTDMGLMITASHNPAKYNGYKVYGNTGCQLANEAAEEIIECINGIDCFMGVVNMGYEPCVESGGIQIIGEQVFEEYLNCVYKESINPIYTPLKIVYTALNGTGYKLCPEILRRAGAKFVLEVKQQNVPDGNFPTCPYPNPEMEAALRLGIDLLKRADSDILIATDPDADRAGVVVMHEGEEVILTGNQIGSLLLDYICSQRKLNGTLPSDPVFVKTIVTTNLASKIAEDYGEIVNVLTGFKYIGGLMDKLEQQGEGDRFVFGFEESYGYLSGAYVRDKDAVVATMLIAEMAAHLKSQGKTLKTRLDELYEQYGHYMHKLLNFEFLGAKGNADMLEFIENLRQNQPHQIGGIDVLKVTDYLTQTEVDLPKENVLVFDLDLNAQVIVRPSGTEPKLKMYITSSGSHDEAQQTLQTLIDACNSMINR